MRKPFVLKASALVLAVAVSTPALAANTSIPLLDFAAGLLNQPNFPHSDNYTTNDDNVTIEGLNGVKLAGNISFPII